MHGLLSPCELQVELNVDDGSLANGPHLSGQTIHLDSDFPVVEGEFNANGIEVIIE